MGTSLCLKGKLKPGLIVLEEYSQNTFTNTYLCTIQVLYLTGLDLFNYSLTTFTPLLVEEA